MIAGMVSMADVVEGRERWHVQHADCRFALSCLPDACIDAVVTDPPAGILFMGQAWDSDKGGRDQWIRWMASVMREVFRVLKPGGHALVWALPRTSHWTAMAVDDAGFQVRDVICHLFATGFPKSSSVSKLIDLAGGASPRDQSALLRARREAAGLTRDDVAARVGCTPASVRDWEEGRARSVGAAIEFIVPSKEYRAALAALLGYSADERRLLGLADDRRGDGSVYGVGHSGELRGGGNTNAARTWEGWGTALKPAAENWILARRPLDGTVAANVLQHGTGALNIDACRVQSGPSADGSVSGDNAFGQDSGWNAHENRTTEIDRTMAAGRWPPNVLFAHADGCRQVGTKRVAGDPRGLPGGTRPGGFGNVGGDSGDAAPNAKVYGDPDGSETVAAWECVPGCPVAALDAQSGERPGMSSGGDGARDASMFGVGGITKPETVRADTGGASRFFPQFQAGEADVPFYYTAKASTAERMAGLDERSVHPTVKPLALMQYLVRLVTPPGGVVLDPFAGSGTTGVAAMLEKGGFRFLGVEREPEYVAIAEARIQHVAGGRWKSPQESAAEAVATGKKKQLTLF